MKRLRKPLASDARFMRAVAIVSAASPSRPVSPCLPVRSHTELRIIREPSPNPSLMKQSLLLLPAVVVALALGACDNPKNDANAAKEKKADAMENAADATKD